MRKTWFSKGFVTSKYAPLGSPSLHCPPPHTHPPDDSNTAVWAHIAKYFFSPVFNSDSGESQSSLLFGLYLPYGYFSQSLLTIEIVLGWDTDTAGCSKCHRQCSCPAWQCPLVGTTGAIWKLLKQEIKQQVLKPPASLATEELALVYDAKHPTILGIPLIPTNTVVKICSW